MSSKSPSARPPSARPPLPEHWVDQNPSTPALPTGGYLASIAALAEVLYETAGGPPPAERIAWLCERIHVMFTDASPGARRLFRLSLWVVNTVSPLLVFRPWPLRWMGHDIRVKALSRLEHSPLAMVLYATKAILAIQYFEHPDSAANAGFDGLSAVAAQEQQS
ncbi:MAG: hypothetical protein ACI9WU_004705 [Myxococcota bacterium]|jgi:hypothetical protein